MGTTDRMSSLDAFFFFAEEDGVNHMHVGGFALVEGTAPEASDIIDALAPKLDQIPRYRQLAQPVPLHLGRPVWVDAPEFDMKRHVGRVDLTGHGHDALRAELEQFISVRLDRTIPLWQILVIGEVEDDRWAIAWKIHHSMVDGVSGTELLTILFDTETAPVRSSEGQWSPRRGVSRPRVFTASVAELVGGLGRTAAGLRPASVKKVGRLTKAYAGMARQTIVPDRSSPLVGKIGPDRSYDFCAVPFEDVKAIRSALGGTVNDVVLTMVLRGFRTLLAARGLAANGKHLQVMVPVALRDRDAEGRPLGDGTMETKASALLARLPLDVDDPVERLRIVGSRLSALKDTSQAEALTAVNEVTALLPGTVTSVVVRGMSKRPQRSLHTTVTNVHGPTMPLYVLGRKIHLIGNYAPPFPIGARSSVTVYSYQGQLVFGVTGDKDSLPDVDLICEGVRETAAQLLSAAETHSAQADAKSPHAPSSTSEPSSQD